MSWLATLVLGFLLGVRHATDADHVVAVTAIVSRQRSARAAVAVGAWWGVGHTATLLLVGGAIVLFGLAIPPSVSRSLEMAVGLMLVVLGVVNVTGAKKVPTRRAREGAGERPLAHVHPHPSGARGLWRPLVVGVVHGLAGSAAVALLVLATIRQPGAAVLYLAIFGAGTIAGMVLLTGGLAMSLATVAARLGALERPLLRLTGAVSIAFGLFLVYRMGGGEVLAGHALGTQR